MFGRTKRKDTVAEAGIQIALPTLTLEDKRFHFSWEDPRTTIESRLGVDVLFVDRDFGVAGATMDKIHERLPALVRECHAEAQREALRSLLDRPTTEA